MTDPTTGGFADTPGPDATPEQDADVRALLAFLRDEPLEMPPDVAARLDAVIAEERRTAALAGGSAAAVLDPSDAPTSPHASVTVLPTLEQRSGVSRTAKILGGLAAAAVVVLGGVALSGSLGGGTSSVTSAGASTAANSAGKDASGVAISASGTQYSTASLAAQATALVAKGVEGAPVSGTAPAVPSPQSATSSTGVTATGRDARTETLAPLAFALDKTAACVSGLTDGDGATAVAIDSGTFNGKAALVVVVTDPQDPTSLRVFVTAPDCSPDFLQYQQIPKP